jgi:hypothetical protein
MKNAEGSLRLYRFQLVGAIGATFLLLGLISVEDLNILPFQLPSKGLAIASIVVGALMILLEGFLVFRRARRLTQSGAQAQKERML